jgi:hypothetical protein
MPTQDGSGDKPKVITEGDKVINAYAFFIKKEKET